MEKSARLLPIFINTQMTTERPSVKEQMKPG
jgi:hypothetical protein